MLRLNRKFFYLVSVIIIIIVAVLTIYLFFTRDGGEQESAPTASIVFADGDWVSIQAHNRIAGYIVEHGYGYKPVYLEGETIPLFTALSQGDVDIMMEVWASDYPQQWEDMSRYGQVKDLGINYTARQGWFIPAYMVEGDTERGIEAIVPELKSVHDLRLYQKIFALSPGSNSRIIYNAPQGWPAEVINRQKLQTYRLSEFFILMDCDSEQSMSETLDQACDREAAWLGYARDPSFVSAGHAMFLLREDPYSEEKWEFDRGCSYPDSEVMKAVSYSIYDKAPELLDFLEKYTTTREQNEAILLAIKNNGGDKELAAREWLQKNPALWSKWVSKAAAEKIWADLNQKSDK